MSMKEYNGLQAEAVYFDNSEDIATVTIPAGYSGCEVSTIEVYTTPVDEEGDEYPDEYRGCYYWTEDDIIFNFLPFAKRGTFG